MIPGLAREYRFVVNDDTIEALRKLRREWRGWRTEGSSLIIECKGDLCVRIEAEEAVPEPGFSVSRLTASVVPPAGGILPADPSRVAFGTGSNDVVLFHSVTWLGQADEHGASDSEYHPELGYGPPGSEPSEASASCLTSDCVLLDSLAGPRLLVRCRGEGLDITEDEDEITAFIQPRGYR